MSVPMGNERIEEVRGVKKTSRGSTYIDWSTLEVASTLDGCLVQPGDSTEEHDRADTEVASWTAWAPLPAVAADSRIRFTQAGITHIADVVGRPKVWVDPTGSGLDHQVIRLRHREG